MGENFPQFNYSLLSFISAETEPKMETNMRSGGLRHGEQLNSYFLSPTFDSFLEHGLHWGAESK